MPLPASFFAVPDWFSSENQGANTAVADLTGSGVVTGGWPPWSDVPDWFSWANQGAGIDVADLSSSGRPDIVVLAVDTPPGRNQAFYRIGTDLAPDGVAAAWSVPLGINNWLSWENQGAGVAVANLGAGPAAVAVAIDAPPGVNNAFTLAEPDQARRGRGLRRRLGSVSFHWGLLNPLASSLRILRPQPPFYSPSTRVRRGKVIHASWRRAALDILRSMQPSTKHFVERIKER